MRVLLGRPRDSIAAQIGIDLASRAEGATDALVPDLIMKAVVYIDECGWRDTGEGFTFEFTDNAGEKYAEIALADSEAKLWKFEVLLPPKFQVEERNPTGIVYSAAGAKRVAETILLNTILVRM